ncbi:hypothetical protein V144x_34230 [Gimesia aquarii]|uniref:Uncharacterized protein n=1 Tax=Gimesia aquarii TaxID=2527964 RepID=A0A517VY62_9PLAN|nr:hypothetical protein V144x_34230 [Gimesia aquarii]
MTQTIQQNTSSLAVSTECLILRTINTIYKYIYEEIHNLINVSITQDSIYRLDFAYLFDLIHVFSS